MTKDDIISMAREAQIIDPSDPEEVAFFVETVEIMITVYNLAVAHEQKRCIEIIYGQCVSDNVAQRTVDAIKGKS
jgi:hypothetical protein